MYERFTADGTTPAYFSLARDNQTIFREILRHRQTEDPRARRDFDIDEPFDDLLINSSHLTGEFAKNVVEDFVLGSDSDSRLIKEYPLLNESQGLIAFGDSKTPYGTFGIYLYDINAELLPAFNRAVMQIRSL